MAAHKSKIDFPTTINSNDLMKTVFFSMGNNVKETLLSHCLNFGLKRVRNAREMHGKSVSKPKWH